MKSTLRITSLLMALILIFLCFPACGKTEKVKLTNVFREEAITIPAKYAENSNFYFNNLYYANNTVYAFCSIWDSVTYKTTQFLVKITEDGTFGEEIFFDFESTENENVYMQSASIGPDGSVWMVLNRYTYSETEGYVEKYELRRYKDSGYETVNLDSLYNEETGERFYINYMAAADDGSLIIATWESAKIITPSGEIKDFKLGGDNENYNINQILTLNGKLYFQIYVYTENSYGYKLCEIDTANQKLGEEIDMPSNMMYNMLTGPGYDFYYNDRTSIYGCTFGKEEKVEVLNFINSDINGNNIYNVIPFSTDKFFTTGYDNNTGMQTCMILTRIPDDQVAEKIILTLAVSYLGYDMREKIIKFNKSNEKYRITVTDYSQYQTNDDYNANVTRLNNDLIAGKIPDILIINEQMPYDSYVAKGIFADLYAMMDADETFNRGDYLENIFKAYESNGKLYSMVPTFYVMTFAGKSSLLEGMEHWNVAEFMAYAKDNPEMRIFDYDFNRENFIMAFMLFARDNFIDRETGKCSFNSEDFRTFLEYTKSLSEDSFWDSIDYNEVGQDFWQEYENRFVENRVLLTQMYLSDVSDSYKSLLNYTLKEEPEFIGFPSEKGNGAIIYANMEMAISARSKNKEGAWEFVKSFISEEALMPVKNNWGYYSNTYGIPILKAALDKQIEIAMTPPEEYNGGGVVPLPRVVYDGTATATATTTADTATADTEADVYEGDVDLNGDGIIDTPAKDIAIEPAPPVDGSYTNPYAIPLTQAQVDKILALINGVTQSARYDTQLNSIISEEAGAYFSDQKSLSQVVDIIQNRVEIYINESR